ncbi:MAG: hypothetical protein RL701_3859 [Pseudomonadota bacterium]|jgi:hypothetical protein
MARHQLTIRLSEHATNILKQRADEADVSLSDMAERLVLKADAARFTVSSATLARVRAVADDYFDGDVNATVEQLVQYGLQEAPFRAAFETLRAAHDVLGKLVSEMRAEPVD